MAANPGIPKPGAKYGPCLTECHHKDCQRSREDAEGHCRLCDTPIGYNTPFYSDPEPLSATAIVHASCLERSLES